MFGFALMGLIINAQKTAPCVIFFYVLISNISTSYRSFQKRFMDIKSIIFRHYEKQDSLTKSGEHYRKTIPKDLFWYICNEREILPFQWEICVMLISMLIISSTLFLALATIVFFGEEYDASPLVSAGAVLRGTLGDCQHRNTAEKNNEHRITAKKVDETPTPQFNFCPTI